MVELEAGDALSVGVMVGSASCRSWPRSTKVSRNVLPWASQVKLSLIAARAPRRTGEIFDRFVHAVVVDVVAGRLGAQHEVIANVLLNEAVAVVAADHRAKQVHGLILRFATVPIMLADPAPEDHRDFVGLSDRAIGVEQALAEFVQRGAAPEDEVVAELNLREEQPMSAAGFLPFPGGKEWREALQPLLAAMQQIPRGERVPASCWRRSGLGASREGIGTLLEVDALLAHSAREPVMLIEADASGERRVGTDAQDKHPSPLPVVDIEVGLDDPAVGDLKVPSVRLAVADRRHDARWSHAL